MPTAALMLAHDIGIRRYGETEDTITRWTDVDRGGHFAALEEHPCSPTTSASSSTISADR